MSTFLTMWLVLVVSCLSARQAKPLPTLGEMKQWRLSTERCDVRIKLSRAVKDGTVLSIEPDGDCMLTVRDETRVLRQVLSEMSFLGHNPSKLQMISTWLRNSEFRASVEDAVFRSGIWKACVGRKYCPQAEEVANGYLSSVLAFREFDTVLGHYGVSIRAIRVDTMAVAARDGRIVCSGLLVISLKRGKEARSGGVSVSTW